MADKYKSLKVKELQEILQKNGLPHTGKKEDLIDRLVKHDEKKALELSSLDDLASLEEFEESAKVDDLDSLPLSSTEQKQDDTKLATPAAASTTTTAEATAPAEKSAETTTTTTTTTIQETTTSSTEQAEQKKDEPPKEITKPGSNFKYTPITFGSSSSTSASPKTLTKPSTSSPLVRTVAGEQSVAGANDAAALELQRKIERAKRFNVDLDEKTKQQLRAQRFGAAAPKQIKKPSSPSPSSKGIDPEVLKKRAERFGLPSKELEEEKKRKRAERFGIPTKEAEEEKKRRRAERFGTGKK